MNALKRSMGVDMRNLMAIVLLTSVVSGGSFDPVFADDAIECREFLKLRKDNDAFTFIEIQSPDKENFLANYNAQEPVSDLHPAQVWVAYIKGDDYVHLSFVDAGCVTYGDKMGTAEFFKMMAPPGNPA